jgi:hypothetical protein
LGRASEAEVAARRAQHLGRSIEVLDYVLQEARAQQGKPVNPMSTP